MFTDVVQTLKHLPATSVITTPCSMSGTGDSLKQCHSKRSCPDCGQRQHSIFHVEGTPQVSQPADNAAASSTGTQQAVVAKPDQVSLDNQLLEKTSLVWMCQVLLEKGGHNQLGRVWVDYVICDREDGEDHCW